MNTSRQSEWEQYAQERNELCAKAHDRYGETLFNCVGMSLAFLQNGDGSIRVEFCGKDVTDEVRQHEIVHDTCEKCGKSPCCLDFKDEVDYKDLRDHISDTSQAMFGAHIMDRTFTYKKQRVALFALACSYLGLVGKGIHSLPECVVDVIHSHAPVEEDG